jgi:hypothetical protein
MESMNIGNIIVLLFVQFVDSAIHVTVSTTSCEIDFFPLLFREIGSSSDALATATFGGVDWSTLLIEQEETDDYT